MFIVASGVVEKTETGFALVSGDVRITFSDEEASTIPNLCDHVGRLVVVEIALGEHHAHQNQASLDVQPGSWNLSPVM